MNKYNALGRVRSSMLREGLPPVPSVSSPSHDFFPPCVLCAAWSCSHHLPSPAPRYPCPTAGPRRPYFAARSKDAIGATRRMKSRVVVRSCRPFSPPDDMVELDCFFVFGLWLEFTLCLWWERERETFLPTSTHLEDLVLAIINIYL